jgi:hypothetical protein
VTFTAILDGRPTAACQITTSDAIDSLWFVRILGMALPATVTDIFLTTVMCPSKVKVKVKGKGEAHRRTGHEGPEVK